jgi:50S ribosomal protein L16 3-hydroxylase
MSIRGGYSTHNENINEFSAEIEEMFNMSAQVDIYLSGQSSRSFGIHEDTSTNFICQMYGKTRWKVFKNRCSDLLRLKKYPMTENDLEIAIDEVLSPGDVLYIPSRNFHMAIPSERRLSLSIVCLPVHYPHRARRIDRKACKLHFPKSSRISSV